MGRALDLIGKKFGYLTVIEKNTKKKKWLYCLEM